MAKRRPWCHRATSLGQTPSTNVAQMRRRHSHALRWGDRIVSHFPHAVVFTFGMIGLSIIMLWAGGTTGWLWASFIMFYSYLAVACGIFLLGFILKPVGKRSIKRDLISRRCHVCVHCFYDLTARPSKNNTCPECGLYTPRRECVRLWCKLLRSRV